MKYTTVSIIPRLLTLLLLIGFVWNDSLHAAAYYRGHPMRPGRNQESEKQRIRDLISREGNKNCDSQAKQAERQWRQFLRNKSNMIMYDKSRKEVVDDIAKTISDEVARFDQKKKLLNLTLEAIETRSPHSTASQPFVRLDNDRFSSALNSFIATMAKQFLHYYGHNFPYFIKHLVIYHYVKSDFPCNWFRFTPAYREDVYGYRIEDSPLSPLLETVASEEKADFQWKEWIISDRWDNGLTSPIVSNTHDTKYMRFNSEAVGNYVNSLRAELTASDESALDITALNDKELLSLATYLFSSMSHELRGSELSGADYFTLLNATPDGIIDWKKSRTTIRRESAANRRAISIFLGNLARPAFQGAHTQLLVPELLLNSVRQLLVVKSQYPGMFRRNPTFDLPSGSLSGLKTNLESLCSEVTNCNPVEFADPLPELTTMNDNAQAVLLTYIDKLLELATLFEHEQDLSNLDKVAEGKLKFQKLMLFLASDNETVSDEIWNCFTSWVSTTINDAFDTHFQKPSLQLSKKQLQAQLDLPEDKVLKLVTFLKTSYKKGLTGPEYMVSMLQPDDTGAEDGEVRIDSHYMNVPDEFAVDPEDIVDNDLMIGRQGVSQTLERLDLSGGQEGLNPDLTFDDGEAIKQVEDFLRRNQLTNQRQLDDFINRQQEILDQPSRDEDFLTEDYQMLRHYFNRYWAKKGKPELSYRQFGYKLLDKASRRLRINPDLRQRVQFRYIRDGGSRSLRLFRPLASSNSIVNLAQQAAAIRSTISLMPSSTVVVSSVASHLSSGPISSVLSAMFVGK